ncbi:helix-turn-helix transcriptional regulator [Streptomyces sp. JJ66]|uniref:helix-turn-helix domain-containing protein n=1 Tax=Streptomyces sp. JJ66 TaxID=2803843 RepID=UPI001C599285|nr:helix-turn-helix transcriptional regulator [Streptomyces sp. JJ66]MBW1600923.1 helix-turn-helix transcriptional regulator [Streptomyces sp. JJ66]
MPAPTEPPSDRVLRRRREIGDNIRDARLQANLTQERLAERAGLSRGSVIRAELGTRAARVDWLIAIADALHVPLSQLVREPHERE